jgi:hypothetical protein
VLSYHGSWTITVVRKISYWPQRLVVGGAVSGVIPVEVGRSVVVDAPYWTLTFEHDDGSGWRTNQRVLPGPLRDDGARASQTIASKDRYWAGDADPNDVVVRLERAGGDFAVIGQPFAADRDSLAPVGDGAFVQSDELQLLGVTIRNTSHQAFDHGSALDISAAGRSALAEHGLVVVDDWSPAVLSHTRQEVFDQAVGLPPLAVGDEATVYFQVDTSGARPGTPDVEFMLVDAAYGTPAGPAQHSAGPVVVSTCQSPAVAEQGSGVSGADLIRSPGSWTPPRVASVAAPIPAEVTESRPAGAKPATQPKPTGRRPDLPDER